MSKTVVIFSGGMDSTVLLKLLVDQDVMVRALGVDYGQRHKKELRAAELIAAELNVPFRVADLSAITPLLAGSSQTSQDVPVPHGHYAAESMKQTVVPNRNMIMLSVAGGYALSIGYDTVAYAAHAGDHAIYPDCRPQFADAVDKAFMEADWKMLRLYRPFIGMSKREIALLGRDLKAPLEKTWSCYEGKDVHCGACGTCVERKEAMQGFDPTEYAQQDLPL